MRCLLRKLHLKVSVVQGKGGFKAAVGHQLLNALLRRLVPVLGLGEDGVAQRRALSCTEVRARVCVSESLVALQGQAHVCMHACTLRYLA